MGTRAVLGAAGENGKGKGARAVWGAAGGNGKAKAPARFGCGGENGRNAGLSTSASVENDASFRLGG